VKIGDFIYFVCTGERPSAWMPVLDTESIKRDMYELYKLCEGGSFSAENLIQQDPGTTESTEDEG